MNGKIKIKNKSQSGLTLIEMMVALFVFSIVVLIAIAIFVNVVQGQRKTKANQDVEENIRYALETMAKEIRMGKDPSVAGGVLTVEAYKAGGSSGSVTYSLSSDQIQRNGSAITSDQIKVTKLIFYVSNAANTQPKVTISITAKSIGSLPEQQTSITVQTTVSSRSYGGGAAAAPPPPVNNNCELGHTDLGEVGGIRNCQATYYASGGDGYVYNAASGINNWSNAHQASAGTITSFGANLAYVGSLRIMYPLPTGDTAIIRRGFFPFNTKDLPDSCLITKVEFKIYAEAQNGIAQYRVVQTNQNSCNLPSCPNGAPCCASLINNDFDQCGSSIQQPISGAISFVITNNWTTFDLNVLGISWIKKDSYTQLGLRENNFDAIFDGANPIPGIGINNSITIRTSDYAGTNFDPQLIVYYEGCL